MIRSACLAAACLVMLWAGCTGCVTPSVPIPPPEATRISFDIDPEAGEATFEYEANASYSLAVVYVFNRTRGVGVIDTARADGSVGPTAPFEAEVDDEIVVSFERDGQLGSICVKLRPGQSGPSLECGL